MLVADTTMGWSDCLVPGHRLLTLTTGPTRVSPLRTPHGRQPGKVVKIR